MKRLRTFMLFGTLAVGAGPAMASSGSLTEFTPRVMPVLVQENSHGKVASASPSIQLGPTLTYGASNGTSATTPTAAPVRANDK